MARGFGAAEGRVRISRDEKGRTFYEDDTSGKIRIKKTYEIMSLGALAAELARLKKTEGELSAAKASGTISADDEKKLAEYQFKLKHATDVHQQRWDAKNFYKGEKKMERGFKKMTNEELIKRREELDAVWMKGGREGTRAGRESDLVRRVLAQRKNEERANEMEKKHAKESAAFKKAARYLAMTGKTLPKQFDPAGFGVPADREGWVSVDDAVKTNEGKALLSKTPVGQLREKEMELVRRAPGNIFLDYEDEGDFDYREIQNTLVDEIDGKQGKFEVKVSSTWNVKHGYDNSYEELERKVFIRKVND